MLGRLARGAAPAVAALSLLAATAPPADRPAATTGGVAGVSDATTEVLAAVNAARVAAARPPLQPEAALLAVASRRAAAAAARGELDSGIDEVQEISRELRRAGYPPYAWRQRLVQGPRDAEALLRQWRASDPDGWEEVVLGDFESLAAARVDDASAPLWSLLFALPRITWERRQAAPLHDLAAVRADLLAAANAERRRVGVAPLAMEARLHGVATDHALDMLRRRFFDHLTPEGASPMARVRAGGYAPQRVTENLAKGLFTPTEVVRRWMLSPGHRRNLLDPAVRDAGIAVVHAEEAGQVQPLWVLVLAAPG